MRSSLRTMLLATGILTSVALCAAAQELVTADHVGKTDAPNTLTMRLNTDQSPNAPVQAIGALYGAAWQKWAEAHPDWQVQFEFFSQDIGAEHARLLEQARAGRSPDCVTVDSFQLALFVQNGVLQPLDAFFSKEEIDDLFPFIRAGITGTDGHIYAWWWGTDLRVLWYNKDLVPTAPQTWDELQAAAVEASKSGVDGVLFNGGRWEGTTFDWLANFWAQGGELVDASGKPIFGEGENREKMLKAINYFKGLVDSGAAPKRVATIKTYDDFNAAAHVGHDRHVLRRPLAELPARGSDAAGRLRQVGRPPSCPGRPPDERSTGTGGWTVAAFSEDPAKVEACASIMREVYMGPANEAGRRPADPPVAVRSLPKFQDPYYRQLNDYLVHGHARPGVPIYPEISNQIQIMMGEVLSGSKSPEEALDGAWQRTMDAYNKA